MTEFLEHVARSSAAAVAFLLPEQMRRINGMGGLM